MGALARLAQGLIYFIMGWAAGGLLDEAAEEVVNEGSCSYTYKVKPLPTCIECQACVSSMGRFMDETGMGNGANGNMNNEQLMALMKEIELVCPVGMVETSISCTTGN